MVKWDSTLEKMVINYSFWKNRRVLLTGHTGFKGSWLTLLLLRLGADVYGLSLPPENDQNLYTDLKKVDFGTKPNSLTEHFCDIRDYSSQKAFISQVQPEVIFHLAAQPLVRRSYLDPLETWSTNVQGSLNLLDSTKSITGKSVLVVITTDKVYENFDWIYGYRENDRLGGHDPYSASKAAVELAVSSWRASFIGNKAHQYQDVLIATARAGNVIGGGDWSPDRIVPDLVRSIVNKTILSLRSPNSTRPWQHVIEPLIGYLMLAEKNFENHCSINNFATAYNFGPKLSSNRSVRDLVEECHKHWQGRWKDISSESAPHEANRLNLQIDKAFHDLNWAPIWDFEVTCSRTINWYKSYYSGLSALEACNADLDFYFS